MDAHRLLRPYVIADIVGLTLTIVGALINTRGAIIEGKDAEKVAHTAGEHNHDLQEAVEVQSRSARYGFRLIALGSSLQILATLLQAAA